MSTCPMSDTAMLARDSRSVSKVCPIRSRPFSRAPLIAFVPTRGAPATRSTTKRQPSHSPPRPQIETKAARCLNFLVTASPPQNLRAAPAPAPHAETSPTPAPTARPQHQPRLTRPTNIRPSTTLLLYSYLRVFSLLLCDFCASALNSFFSPFFSVTSALPSPPSLVKPFLRFPAKSQDT